MTASRRIVLADDEPPTRQYFRACLERMGHQVVGEAASGEELVRLCRVQQPELVVADVRLEGMGGFSAIRQIQQDLHLPVVFISGSCDRESLAIADACHASAYLIKPLDELDLQAAVSLALGRHADYLAERAKAEEASKSLAERKLIERAKGVVMDRQALGEAAAFKQLQTTARQRRIKLAELAQSILDAQAVL